jgi:hypothetical protein
MRELKRAFMSGRYGKDIKCLKECRKVVVLIAKKTNTGNC